MERDKPLGPWPLIERVPLGDFKVFRVRKDVSRSPRTGLPHDFFVLDGNDWVNVVAITRKNEIVLIRQFRAGTRSVTLEIPGGSVETGESPLRAARRELREETGYVSKRWKRIGVVDPNPAVQSNVCSTYLAAGAVRVGDPTPDGSEDLVVETYPVGDIDTLVKEGRIRHALVLAAFHWFRLRRGQGKRAS